MSWTSTTGYSPTILKKPSSVGSIMGGGIASSGNGASHATSGANVAALGLGLESGAASGNAGEQEVIVPLVLWNEPPQVQVSCLHVLYLPLSQPSQNSNTTTHASFVRRNSDGNGSGLSRKKSARDSGNSGDKTTDFAGLQIQIVDDEDDVDDALYQVCVFAGTVDGVIIYWLFEQEAVVQVNMLLFSSNESTTEEGESSHRKGFSSQPVQGIVSGTDEWGQSMLISVARDGSVARWELPNGMCSRASASLAKQLAPIKGMEMFCNNRYAMIYSEETRMMVLDTWKMNLLYCMDTAQEQIRRSLAVGELKMPTLKCWSNSGSASLGRTAGDTQGEALSLSSQSVGPNGSSVANSSSLSGANMQNALANSSANTNNKSFNIPGTSGNGMNVWDSLVISLGAEGLVKCFLWSRPRSGPSAPGNGLGGFQWTQESCWVISWADETDDITCSQSTSLKDGDNMNPQTALMRSIKSSYFPLAVHVSPDASLVLFIWKTKWVVLKRKWLCKIEALTSVSSRSKSSTKKNSNVPVGSCKIPPSALIGRGNFEYSDNGESTEPVCWENGGFLGENQVILWTNTGHVFQFAACGNSMSSAGKLFIFTKDQDQFVPRSNFKNLTVIEKGQYIAFLNQCVCCSKTQKTNAKATRSIIGGQLWNRSHDFSSGFTACVQSSSSGSSSSPLSLPFTQTKLIHMCKRGSVGFWDISSNKCSSPPRMTKAHAFPIHLYDRVKFHSFADGFDGKLSDSNTSSSSEQISEKREDRRVSLSHLMLGRDDSGSSSSYDDSMQLGTRRRRRRRLQELDRSGSAIATTTNTGGDSPGTGVFSGSLGSNGARNSSAPKDQRRGSIGFSGSVSEMSSRYLMDVPVIAKGYSDGSVEFSMLGRKKLTQGSESRGVQSQVHLCCHRGNVTAIAHCHWVAPSVSVIESSPSASPLSLERTATVESPRNGAISTKLAGGLPLSVKRTKTWKRGVPIEESSLASDKNPFYRSRFPAPTQRRSWSSRNLSINSSPPHGSSLHSTPISVSAPPSPSSRSSMPSAIHFMVFTGGEDGVLRVIELTVRPVDSNFTCEVTILQRFRKHRGAIKEIAISPVRDRGSSWFAQCPDRFVATVGMDHKVTLYAPVYQYHPNSRLSLSQSSLKSRCGVEWECILELSEHTDAICDLDWHLERGLLYVECEDRMVYVWNTDTGILERTLPTALLRGGGNSAMDDGTDSAEYKKLSTESVESSDVMVGDSSVHLLKFRVIRSAEHIKSSWKSYFYGLSNTEPPDLSLTAGQSAAPSPVSPYAIGSIELLLLSFLLSWGATPEIDRSCRELLGLDAPHLSYSCALRDGSSGALTIPVPWKISPKYRSRSVLNVLSPSAKSNAFVRNWQHSSALSANLALGIVSLCMNLMEHKYSKPGSGVENQSLTLPSSPKNKEEFHVLWSQLITQHSVVLPDYVPCFREPALEYLAEFGFNSCDYTQLAARALLNGVIKRLPSSSRSTLTAEYSTKLHFEIVRLEMDTGSKLNGSSSGNAIDFSLVVARLGSLVILLSMIGTCYPGEISPASAREVCDILVYLLKAPAQHIGSVSAELLTKGLMLFRPHLVDLSSLIVQLLLIDMREKQRNPDGSASPVFGSNARVLANGGSNASLSLLIELGACETAFVLALLQQEINNNDRPHAFRECVLLYLTELINTHYLLMFRHLPAVVDTIMCCLDPTKPDRRKRCLELSTRCLHNLVRRFPMIDFHKETQRLAIGTMEAVILIYDLRTATKWRVLDGHSSAVSAVGFRQDGQILVSYAAREGSVRWWNSGNAGLFGGMLKMQQSCLKEHKLDILKSSASAPSPSGGASADLKQVIQTCRFQFLTLAEPSITTSNNAASELKEKKILRLTREDASQVQFLL